MDRLSENKIIVVRRKTRLEDLIARFNTVEQAKFYIEHLGADFLDYIKEDEEYKKVVFEATNTLNYLGRVHVIDRMFLSNFIFGKKDLVIAIGQDGLVANTLKYLDSQLLIGVNPDPQRWDGVLLPFCLKDLKTIVPEVFQERRTVKRVTMAKATMNDGQTLYGVNDLFIGQKSHVSARYEIKMGNRKEQQSSSGIIISTGLGSTGWLKSILVGAAAITGTGTNNVAPTIPIHKMSWDEDSLIFSVREPFPSKITKTNIAFGKVTTKEPMKITSLMPENGVVFSDGIENDFLSFNSGITVTITIAEKKGHLVV
jgi:NAD kinase